MITRIEISGFKTFTDFAVDLAPFTVIAGANASGKSNLLDALQIVSDLMIPQESFPNFKLRGGISEAFTKYDGTHQSNDIKFAVELLLPKRMTVDGEDQDLMHSRFRYEVSVYEVIYEDHEKRLFVNGESLASISRNDDRWIDTYLTKKQREKYGLELPRQSIVLIRDDQYMSASTPGGKFGKWPAGESQALLSAPFIGANIHARAVRQHLQSLKRVDAIDPANFSNFNTGYSNKEEYNSIIGELIKAGKDDDKISMISSRVKKIINEVSKINVYTDRFLRTTLTATDTLEREIIADNLSEGTLRILALCVLLLRRSENDIVLTEEPENGVDPRVLDELLTLLLDLTATFDDPNDLRQIICTTHSPTLLQEALNRQKDRNAIRVLLATKVTLLTTINGQRRKLPTTRMNEVVTSASEDDTAEPLTRYTLRQALDYLNRLQLPESLQKALPNA